MANRKFATGYLIQDSISIVGITVLTELDSSKDRKVIHACIIGFDTKPEVDKYNKFILLTGDNALNAVPIPDTGMIAKLPDLFNGRLITIRSRAPDRLFLKSSAMRNGKKVSIFSMSKTVWTASVDVDENALASLRNKIGGNDWTTARKRTDTRALTRRESNMKDVPSTSDNHHVNNPPLTQNITCSGDDFDFGSIHESTRVENPINGSDTENDEDNGENNSLVEKERLYLCVLDKNHRPMDTCTRYFLDTFSGDSGDVDHASPGECVIIEIADIPHVYYLMTQEKITSRTLRYLVQSLKKAISSSVPRYEIVISSESCFGNHDIDKINRLLGDEDGFKFSYISTDFGLRGRSRGSDDGIMISREDEVDETSLINVAEDDSREIIGTFTYSEEYSSEFSNSSLLEFNNDNIPVIDKVFSGLSYLQLKPLRISNCESDNFRSNDEPDHFLFLDYSNNGSYVTTVQRENPSSVVLRVVFEKDIELRCYAYVVDS